MLVGGVLVYYSSRRAGVERETGLAADPSPTLPPDMGFRFDVAAGTCSVLDCEEKCVGDGCASGSDVTWPLRFPTAPVAPATYCFCGYACTDECCDTASNAVACYDRDAGVCSAGDCDMCVGDGCDADTAGQYCYCGNTCSFYNDCCATADAAGQCAADDSSLRRCQDSVPQGFTVHWQWFCPMWAQGGRWASAVAAAFDTSGRLETRAASMVDMIQERPAHATAVGTRSKARTTRVRSKRASSLPRALSTLSN